MNTTATGEANRARALEWKRNNPAKVYATRTAYTERIQSSPKAQWAIQCTDGRTYYVLARTAGLAQSSAIRSGFVAAPSEITQIKIYSP